MQCGGLTRALIRDYDWAATALVPINTWPQSLETAVGMVLHSTVPIVLLWGADGVVICNDTYSRFAGARHPQTLGAKVREAWVEVADFNDNVVKVGLSGGTLAYKDQALTLYGYGVAAQVWMSLNYSPVLDAYRRDRDRARNHGSSAGGSAQRGRARSIAQDVRTPPRIHGGAQRAEPCIHSCQRRLHAFDRPARCDRNVGNGHLDHGMQLLTKPSVLATLAGQVREMSES